MHINLPMTCVDAILEIIVTFVVVLQMKTLSFLHLDIIRGDDLSFNIVHANHSWSYIN